MTEWQPIETAPRDRPILGFGQKWQGEIYGVFDGPTFDIIEGGPRADTDWEKNGEWWLCTTGDAYACWLLPTHWQPLPDPPKEQAA